MKVAAIVPYHTDFCAGQRFRIELWARHLKDRGIEVEYYPFASPALTGILYDAAGIWRKSGRMLRCYVEQLHRVLSSARPDVVYIYREAAWASVLRGDASFFFTGRTSIRRGSSRRSSTICLKVSVRRVRMECSCAIFFMCRMWLMLSSRCLGAK